MRKLCIHAMTVCLVVLGVANQACAISITCVGSWAQTINQANLVGGPGSALTATYASASNAGVISISGVYPTTGSWRVDVRRTDTTWYSSFVLSIRRTGNGSGTGTISGGTTYQTIGTTSQTFFQGSRNRSNVPVQLQLGGVSHAVPVNTYSTTVVFTVVGT